MTFEKAGRMSTDILWCWCPLAKDQQEHTRSGTSFIYCLLNCAASQWEDVWKDFIGFRLVLMTWGEVLRKRGFALIGCCQKIGVILWLGILTGLEERLQVWLGKKEHSPLLPGMGDVLVFCALDNVHVLSVFTHMELSCFCLHPSWPQSGLVWYWCSIKLFMFNKRTPICVCQASSHMLTYVMCFIYT